MAGSPSGDPPCKFLAQGAIIQEFVVAGKNLVLSFPDAEPYLAAPFFGETIGRVANRIEDGLIRSLNGRSYQLAANDGTHNLHGGQRGWGKKVFSGPHPVDRNGRQSVLFTYLSPDGEEGFPGTVEIRVWYTSYEEKGESTAKTVLEVEYEVELVGTECDETVVNVTNHSYFHLGDGPTVEGTRCVLSTAEHLSMTADSIPTGAIEKLPGVEAGKEFVLDSSKLDVDHCFVMDTDAAAVPLDTRARTPQNLVTLSHPSAGFHLVVESTEPAFQFYAGKYIDVPASSQTRSFGSGAGICIEPSRFVNAINQPRWRSMVLLPQGRLWGSRTIYRAWKA